MENKESKGLAINKPIVDVLSNIDLVNNREAALLIFKDLVASGKMNVKTPAEAIAMYLKSKELGLPFITASDHMHMVQGKAGVDIHILRAMVLKAGLVYWYTETDYKPLYEYKDNTGFVIDTCYTDDQLPDIYAIPKGDTSELLKEDYTRITSIGKIPVFKTLSYCNLIQDGVVISKIPNKGTVIRFERILPWLDGNKTLIEYGRFTTKDAIDAGLHLKRDGSINPSSPHLIYARIQQEHRAWTYGARKIASDTLLGLYETKELYDMNHTDYTITEEGTAVIVQD